MKPGKLARRLGFAVRAALWTVGGLLAASYLLIFVSPLPPPAHDADGPPDLRQDGRLVVDLDGRTSGSPRLSLEELSERLQHVAAPPSDTDGPPGGVDEVVYSEER